ncbi:glycoside hydrolase domain-containing protein [Thomasclavelia spiroformis]|uniref:glycoside hydrolase domain-containing protein n=1 Tax=Thomasclavelia spiroformis TaxID=29348 RepID=UPI0024B13EA8|nr:glycoside hydrolase domain-containing protein [Thomasclavelia spiroformis]
MITGMVTLTNILGSASTVFAKESTNYEITTNNYETKDLVQHVNPLIGTNNFKGDSEWSGTAPLVSAPFGMTNFTPQTRENRIGDISYEYKDTKFKGFFATHQPAIWMGDYGYVNVMPQIGDVSPDQDGRALTFSHDDETATPYYYKVTAGKEEGKPITAEMTATERCAIYRFTYPSSDEAKIFVESARGRGNGHIEIDEDYEKYIQSSKKWLNNWDENLVSSDGYKGFIHKRAEDGSYATVDPSHFLGYDGTEMKWQGYGDDFYEAGIWEGSYSPTFDLPTLVEKMGGKYAYADRLDYALGQGYINFANESAFQTIWTLASDEVQRPDLASKWVDVYLSKYTDVGYPGDEDNGAMSSMYLFMMSGFFPMSATNNYYLHGTRLPEVTYHLGTGNDFVIKGINVSDENIYVQSATWNGQPLTSSKLTWEQIKEGGTLEYVMGSQPSDWAREVDNENPSDVTGLTLDDSKLNEGTLALNWNEATDNTQIKQYNIYSSIQEDFELNDETLVTSTKDTTYTFDVSNEVKYFKVEAEDYFGNKSLNSPLIKVDISDFEKPILTGEIQLDEKYLDIGLVKFSWPEATDNIKIKEYRVYRGNEENYDLDETSLLTATNDLSYSETKQAGTFYYTVVAVDLFGNVSDSLKLKVENSNGLTGKKLKSTENIAKNKNVTASGRHSEAEDGKYAVDGNTKTKWCSKDNESSANPDFWLEIDLGDVYQLNKWVVKHAQAGGEQASYNTRDFKLQVKSGDEWLDVDSVVGNTDSTTSRTLPMFEGRYVRLYVTNPTQANQARTTRIYEVELYGDKDYSTFTGSIMKTPGIEVSVNHAVNENEDAIKAIDFDTNTKWSCRNSNDDNGYYWLEVKLPQKYRVNALELLSAEKENASYITRDFQLQVKENGEWKDVHNVTGNQENLYYANLETPVIGDNFRLLIKKLGSANEDNARVYEFHLYGDKVVDSNKTALKIAVDLANTITDEDLANVVPAVVEEFKVALQEANEVYNNVGASQADVNAAFDRLASAMQMLDFVKGDKTALKAFIDKVSGLDSTKYTEATWTAFETKLNEAVSVYNDENAMQEEVNNAYKELVTAFLNLRLIPDKSLLEELINQASGLNVANYTKASFDGLTKALNEAKAVFENPNATQKEIDNAKATLEKAINGLEANINAPVDNTVNTPVNNGDVTVSVETGDNSLTGIFATMALLSIAGYTILKRKEN